MGMKLGMLGWLAASMPASANAATDVYGILWPVDGKATLLSPPYLFDPAAMVPAGKRATVSFSVFDGVIADVVSTLQYRWTYGIVPSNPNAVPFGNDVDGTEVCTFSGAGPGGCYTEGFMEPGQSLRPSLLMTNLVVSPQSISYDLYRPPSFDRCDHPTYDEVCSSSWTMSNDYQFTVASDKVFTFKLSVSDPMAVPEPASWAMMIAGFGAIGSWQRGSRMRERRSRLAAQVEVA